MAIDFTPDAASAQGTTDQPAAPTIDFKPDPAPIATPDTANIEATVKANLAAQPAPAGETSAQRLDRGLGMPVSSILRGNDKDTPLPPHVRSGLMGAYKDGTATSVSDYMQTVLPAAANAASLTPEKGMMDTIDDIIKSAGGTAGKFAAQETSMVVTRGFAGAAAQNLIDAARSIINIPIVAGGLAAATGAEAISGVKTLPSTLATITNPLGALGKAVGSDMLSGEPTVQEAALTKSAGAGMASATGGVVNPDYEPQTMPGKIAKTMTELAPFSAAGEGSFLSKLIALASISTAGQEVPVQVKKAGGSETVQQLAGLMSMVLTGVATHATINRFTANGTVVGHEALKGHAADALGTDPAAVTGADIDQVIHENTADRARSAQDYHDTGTVMSANAPAPERKIALNTPIDAGKGNGTWTYKLRDDGLLERHIVNEDGSEETAILHERRDGNQLWYDKSKPIDRNAIPVQFESADHATDFIESDLPSQKAAHPQSVTDTLHTITEKTGLSPDKVYEDAQSHPEIMQDILAGKVPERYAPQEAQQRMAELERELDHKDTTPERGEEIKAEMDNLTEQAVGNAAEGQHPVEEKVANMRPEFQKERLDSLNNKAANGVPLTLSEMRERELLSEKVSGKNAESMAGAPPEEPPIESGRGENVDDRDHQDSLPPEQEPAGPKRSKEGASTSVNPLSKIFNPAGMSDSSKDMATALRQAKGPGAQLVARIQDGMQKFAKTIAAMTDEDRLGLIDYMENRSSGAKIADAKLQELADKIRDIYAQMAEKVQQAFPDVGLREDYFTHQYEDEKEAAKFFSDWVAKQGSGRNLKQRAFPTLKEAMDAGLKPKTTNPIETVMRYVTNMNNLITAHEGVKLAREFGVADYFKRGEQPEGWVPLNGNLAEETTLPEGSSTGKAIPTSKVLYAPEDAARVYNNDISEGATGPIGDIADMVQHANNFASKLVLGLSGYHFSATTMASMASDIGRALTMGSAGERASALKAALTPGKNFVEGGKLIDAYLGKSELSPELQKAMDLAVKNNTISIKQQDYWKAGPAKDYVDVFKNGSAGTEFKNAIADIKAHPVTGTAKVIATEIGRTMDTISKPLFDSYIPRIKISANIAELHAWLSEHPEATPEEMDKAAQDIGNSVDNRFGEMMRDNLFWHQLTRQSLQTALLSYSWVAGGARMLKGIPDVGMTIMGKQGLSSNARYLFGMAASYALVNGVRTYIGTGKAPNNYEDFIYPRTGGYTPQGLPERELLPGHTGQYTNYLHEGLKELGNEASPGLKLLYHLLSNSDFRGLPITNANNAWFGEQRWEDYIKYTLGEVEPMGIKNFLQGEKKGSHISAVEQMLGARPAPRFINDPEGYERMMKRVNDKEYQRKVRSDTRMREQYENN